MWPPSMMRPANQSHILCERLKRAGEPSGAFGAGAALEGVVPVGVCLGGIPDRQLRRLLAGIHMSRTTENMRTTANSQIR